MSSTACALATLVSVVGLPEVSVDEDGDLIIDGDGDEATPKETAEATDEDTDEE